MNASDIGKTSENQPGRDKPTATYRTRIGQEDHFNSHGEVLRIASQILSQDRANYHRFDKRDPEDQSDTIFSEPDRRRLLPMLAEAALKDKPELRKQILTGEPLIEVSVYEKTADAPLRIEVSLAEP